MQAILYVAHGTRVQRGVEEAIQFIKDTQKKINVAIQEIAFLELVEPDILQGIQNCVRQGATRIAVVPILLLTAQHAKEDIPKEVANARRIFPNVQFTIGHPFGVHEKCIDTIYERIVTQPIEIMPNAEVLLVGRGSSDVAVARDLGEIGQRLQRKYHFNHVSTCFLYGTGPSFEESLIDMKKRKVTQLYIVPYLLFTGLLKKGIEQKVRELEVDESRIILCDSLGYNDNVRQVLIERVHEAIH